MQRYLKRLQYVLNRNWLLPGGAVVCYLLSGCCTFENITYPTPSEHKYAVLISACEVGIDTEYGVEFWSDLRWQYRMLREHGFSDENIHVLYGGDPDGDGKGNDFNRCGSIKWFDREITDMPVSKAKIDEVFTTLSGKLTKDDLLYVWWTGHGQSEAETSPCNLKMSIWTKTENGNIDSEVVTDVELRLFIDKIAEYKKIILAVETCNSGGIVDNMNTGTNTVTFAASTCEQNSYITDESCDYVSHAQFNYLLINALRQKECDSAIPSEDPLDGDDYVSLLEAYHYITAEMQGSTRQTPQKGDPDDIAKETHIKKDPP